MVHGKITHRHTDHLAGWHSVQTNQRPTSFIPYFYAGCPSCCNLHNLSWLGSGTKYAGLHTQWLGLYYREFVCISVICPLLSADEGSVSSTTGGSIATLTAFISQQTHYVNTREERSTRQRQQAECASAEIHHVTLNDEHFLTGILETGLWDNEHSQNLRCICAKYVCANYQTKIASNSISAKKK